MSRRYKRHDWHEINQGATTTGRIYTGKGVDVLGTDLGPRPLWQCSLCWTRVFWRTKPSVNVCKILKINRDCHVMCMAHVKHIHES